MDLKAHIGSRVKAARSTAGLTQESLADAIGVSARTVSNVEGGHTLVSMALLANIATTLKRPLTYFFEGFEEPKATVDPKRSKTEQDLFALIGTLPSEVLPLAASLLKAVKTYMARAL